MNLRVFPAKIRLSPSRPANSQPGTCSPAGLHPLTPEQEARAQIEMAASDEPAFDWPGTVSACVELTRQGWMARAKFVLAWDRWVVEARHKAWPPDWWGTLRKDGQVRPIPVRPEALDRLRPEQVPTPRGELGEAAQASAGAAMDTAT